MKVRKEQFLLPKGKTITSNAQWVQTTGKPCSFTKTLTPIVSQQIIEGLPSALVAKVKPDFVLPNGDVILSGNSGGPIYWQQQNGILRQALLNTEKDVKVGEKLNDTINITTSQNQNEPCVISNNGVLSITTVTPQQLTPLTSPQVIKMSDCQVILGEALPLSWQDISSKKNVVPVSSLPSSIENKDWDRTQIETSFVISDHMSIGHLSNISVLSKNQYSTIVIKDGENTLTADFSPTKSDSIHMVPFVSKKIPNKPAAKATKIRKKTNQTKKIKIKPASSLLSKSALDYTNKEKDVPYERPVDVNSFNELTIISEVELQENNGMGINYTTEVLTEPIDLVTSATSSPLSKSTNMQTRGSIHSLNSDIPFESDGNNIPSSHYNLKTSFSSQDLNSTRGSTESNIVFDATDVNLIESSVGESSILVTSCIVNREEPLHLDGTVIVHDTIIDTADLSNSKGICSEVESLPVLDESVIVCENNCDAQHSDNINDFDRNDHTHTILSSDIEHEEQHPQEYSDNLLSQLSRSRVLPNMSSSQVSSVLNALSTSDKTDRNNLSNSARSIKQSVKSEPSDFVKIEALNVKNVSRLMNKESVTKYRVYELNNQTCFRCMKCMFMSLKTDSIDKHWAEEHQLTVEKNSAKRTIKCLGCPNVVYSKYALQVHLLCDHNVSTTEVHDLIAATFSANKSLRDVKKQPLCKTTTQQKTKIPSPQREREPMKVVPDSLPEETYQSNIVSVITQCLSPVSTEEHFMETSVHLSQPEKDNEQKLSTEVIPELPSTPSFCLFSEVQVPNDKEERFTLDIPSCDDNKALSVKKVELRSPVRYKTPRNKLKSEFSNEVKITHRCMVDRCGVRVSNMVNLSYHLRCHKPDSDLLVCPECEYSVISWSSMTAHLWRRHNIDIDLFSCKHCNYKTNSYSRLINGHVKTHGEERPFLCDVCGKGFKTKKQMRNHKMIHRARRRNGLVKTGESDGVENLSETGNTCHICSRTFADSRILKHHTANVHNRARPYFCTFCAHSASSKSSLRMHIRQHTGEKPFSCDECDYTTSDHNSLRRHKMRHSGKRPYQCPHCPYNCIQATTYKSHLKNKHPGLDEGLMFSCPSCPFRTVKRDNYLSHKAQHDLGGDPRGKRRHTQQSPELLQDHLSSSSSYLLQDDVVVLQNHTDDLSAAVQNNTMELIVPEVSSVLS